MSSVNLPDPEVFLLCLTPAKGVDETVCHFVPLQFSMR